MNSRNLNLLAVLLSLTMVFVSCEKDVESNDSPTSKGNVNFEVTDAPIDNAEVKSAFITIAEVKLDGKAVEGFNKTTVDLLAYQNGSTKTLFNSELESKTYANIELVLDLDTDANGNAPGCYIEETDGTKHELSSETNTITLENQMTVESNTETNFVLDFDLRKCIKKQEGSADDIFDFVTEAEMKNSLRLVNKKNTGTITGNCSNAFSNSDRIVVYAYENGTYHQETEVSGQGDSNIEFLKAVSSAMVDAHGNFELHFLNEGEYELKLVSYQETESGEFELDGTLLVEVIGSLDIGAISVNASDVTTVDVNVIELMPI